MSYADHDDAIATDEDLPFEEDVMRNIYDFRSWWRYLQFKGDAPPRIRFMLYERALKELPGSYKLWYHYLQERKQAVSGLRIDHPAYDQLNNTFERCLAYMHKMPRIWLEYLGFLLTQRKLTQTRRAFDRALRALPITQHHRVWPLYVQFAKQCAVPETAVRIFRRFLKLEPDHLEEYANFLVSVGYMDEAAKVLSRIVNDEHFISRQGKSRHELWMQLCDILTQHPEQIHSVRVEPVIRSALAKYTNEVGKLWTSLADYYVRLGNFEKARDVFEEGINSVLTVRDFTQIWEAYNQFEYGLITAQLEEQQDPASAAAFELRMARFEDLIDRQPLLISNVLLRQNPHNVYEWHKRVKLFDADPQRKLEEYTRGCTTVDPHKATGKLNTLWVSFARFWEENEQYDDARKVFEKALNVNYKKVEELAAVWSDYVEFELRRHNYDRARELIQRATVVPKNRAIPRDAPVAKRVYKSVRLWALYADLEENLGTFMTTKAVYEKIIDLKLITPQMTVNYAHWLEEHNHFEESFKAYERGIALFQFPHVTELWITYLTKFMRRYGGSKLERLRDLFEQAIESAPAKEATLFYLMYADAEEKYGLARHVLQIFDRATRHVHADDRPFIFNLYLAKATEFFGVTRTREIFEKAVETLPEKQIKEYCMRFANLERKLGEIDRARSIYIHCAQFCDPRTEQKFWEIWKEFEVRHGNVETFKEMLRIKRSVTAQYSIAVQMPVAPAPSADAGPEDPLQRLEAEASTGPALGKRFVGGSTLRPEELGLDASETGVSARPATAANTEEIELDLDEGEGEEAEQQEEPAPSDKNKKRVELEEIRVPQAVFGGLVEDASEDTETDAQGAKDRLKKRKRGPNH